MSNVLARLIARLVFIIDCKSLEPYVRDTAKDAIDELARLCALVEAKNRALRLALEEMTFDEKYSIVGQTGEKRVLDQAVRIAQAALEKE